ncbi:MAG: DJ-1/PfpI family protein [Oscillospiraceae bacterium]
MKDVFLIYDRCCFYEIVTLSYFMRFSGCDMAFCAPAGRPVRAMEGFTVQPDLALEELDPEQVRSFILPGGAVSAVNRPEVWRLLQELKAKQALIAGICAGVDVLDDAGLLGDVRSTHSTDEDLVCDRNIITARANAHVDFAIKTAETLGLFSGEEDLRETVAFWKHNQRMQ